jgi:cytochrome P450
MSESREVKTDQSYPPLSKGKPLVGHLLDFRGDRLGFLMGLVKQHGNVVRFKMGPLDLYLVNEPEIIKDVLVTNNKNFVKSRGLEMAKRFLGEGMLTSEGEFHRRQRRLAQPAFHRQRIASYARVMTEYAARLADEWQPGATVDMSQEMMRLTLEIVGKTLFDADVAGDAREIGAALTEIMHLFNSALTMPFAGLLEKLPLPSTRRFEKARARLDSVMYRIIDERRAGGVDRGDLLSMLLHARDEEGDGGGMTDLQVRDEAMTIFIAGHETTANAMTWTWYLLSEHPEAEAKLHAEIDAALEGRLPTADDVARLTYTEMVLAESMRLYPPAWTIGRRALNDYRFGELHVPAGSIILMSQYVTHHDSRFYPDPFHFDPERWTPEAQASRPKFSYFPFGGGPRVCIGEPFAWMEAVLLTATVARKWRMRLAHGQKVEPEPLVTLRPKHGMRLTLELREGAQVNRTAR